MSTKPLWASRLRWLTAAGLALILAIVQAAPAVAAPAAGLTKTGLSGQGACTPALAAGTHTLTIQSGGQDRTVVVYVPNHTRGRGRLPLILNLHGSQADATLQMSISDLAVAAERGKFVVAAAQGSVAAPPGYRWNVPGVTLPPGEPPDDERFLSDTIDALVGLLCIDEQRVYGTGYSGGGRMISQYACDHPERIAAIAPVVGLRAGYPVSGQAYPDPATCNPSRPVPVLTFAGTEDFVNPYAGGGAAYWQYGAEAALARWAEINGCRPNPRTRQVTEHVRLISYRGCRANADVQMYVAEGAGHTWPGSEYSVGLYQGALGEITFEIDATDLMVAFFMRHRAPGSHHR